MTSLGGYVNCGKWVRHLGNTSMWGTLPTVRENRLAKMDTSLRRKGTVAKF